MTSCAHTKDAYDSEGLTMPVKIHLVICGLGPQFPRVTRRRAFRSFFAREILPMIWGRQESLLSSVSPRYLASREYATGVPSTLRALGGMDCVRVKNTACVLWGLKVSPHVLPHVVRRLMIS